MRLELFLRDDESTFISVFDILDFQVVKTLYKSVTGGLCLFVKSFFKNDGTGNIMSNYYYYLELLFEYVAATM